MRILGVNLEGRLGNQLFQYAFIYVLAKKYKGWFFVDQSKFAFFPAKYFVLPSYIPNRNRVLFKLYLHFKSFFKHISEKDVSKHQPDRLNLYVGYFQSEKYIFGYEKDIRKEFAVKREFTKKFEEKFGKLYAEHKIIGVHVRKTDIVNLGFRRGTPVDASMSMEYYNACFAHIKNIEQYKIVFATDDIGYVRENFSYLPNIVVEQNDEITDMQVLMNADIVVTANSSFSWWGAWLNTKANKVVYAPKNWTGTHKGELYPPHIFEGLNWVKI